MVAIARSVERLTSGRVASNRLPSNRRSHRRIPLRGTAAYLSASRLLIARVGNLCGGGAFLVTRNPDPLGTKATLELELDGSPLSLHVEVVRVSFLGGSTGAEAGMGVQFLGAPRALRRRLMDAHGLMIDG